MPPTPPSTATIHWAPSCGIDGTSPAAISLTGGAISAVVPTTVTNISPIRTDIVDSKALKLPFMTMANPAKEWMTAQTTTEVSVAPIGRSAVPATPQALASARPTTTVNSVR